MFSFRTSSIFEQEDKLLHKGSLGVLCDNSAWYPSSGEYLWEILQKRGNLEKIFNPEDEIEAEDLSSIDALIIELQDSGVRYSPYPNLILKLFRTLKDNSLDIAVYVVDKQNPAGRCVEGSMLREGYRSEIGVAGIPQKHGLTIGELATYFHNEVNAKFALHIISYKGSESFNFIMPWSIPVGEENSGLFTAAMYSGTALWGATNVSCGKGTSRPYELFGAPWFSELLPYLKEHGISGWNSKESPLYDDGAFVRVTDFIPGHDIYADELCLGFQIIMNPSLQYCPLAHNLRMIRFVKENTASFLFNTDIKAGVDSNKTILELMLGDKELADFLYGESSYTDLKEHLKVEEQKWIRKAKKFILYEDDQIFRVK